MCISTINRLMQAIKGLKAKAKDLDFDLKDQGQCQELTSLNVINLILLLLLSEL